MEAYLMNYKDLLSLYESLIVVLEDAEKDARRNLFQAYADSADAQTEFQNAVQQGEDLRKQCNSQVPKDDVTKKRFEKIGNNIRQAGEKAFIADINTGQAFQNFQRAKDSSPKEGKVIAFPKSKASESLLELWEMLGTTISAMMGGVQPINVVGATSLTKQSKGRQKLNDKRCKKVPRIRKHYIE